MKCRMQYGCYDLTFLIMYDVFVIDLTFSFDSFRNIGQLLIEIFLNVNNWARKIICFECITTWCWLIRFICMDLLLRHFYHHLPCHRVPVPEPKLPTVSLLPTQEVSSYPYSTLQSWPLLSVFSNLEKVLNIEFLLWKLINFRWELLKQNLYPMENSKINLNVFEIENILPAISYY